MNQLLTTRRTFLSALLGVAALAGTACSQPAEEAPETADGEITDEMFQEVRQFAAFIKSKKQS